MDFMPIYVRLTYRTSRVATMLLRRDFFHLDVYALPFIIGRVRLLMRSHVFTRNQI